MTNYFASELVKRNINHYMHVGNVTSNTWLKSCCRIRNLLS